VLAPGFARRQHLTPRSFSPPRFRGTCWHAHSPIQGRKRPFEGRPPGCARRPPLKRPFSCRVLVPGYGPAPGAGKGRSGPYPRRLLKTQSVGLPLEGGAFGFAPRDRSEEKERGVRCGHRAKPGARTSHLAFISHVLVPGYGPAPGAGKGRSDPHPNQLLKEPMWSSTSTASRGKRGVRSWRRHLTPRFPPRLVLEAPANTS